VLELINSYPLYESEPDVWVFNLYLQSLLTYRLLPVPGLRVLEKEKSVPVRGSFVEM
jgi:hypothetical protein